MGHDLGAARAGRRVKARQHDHLQPLHIRPPLYSQSVHSLSLLLPPKLTRATVYYQDWHRSPLKPARPGTSVLPSVSPAVSPLPSSSNSPTAGFDAERQAASTGKLPFRNTTGIDLGGESSPTSSTGAGSATRSGTGEQSLNAPLSVAGWKEAQEREARERARLEEERRVGGRGLPFDEEAKLVYGVVFSLRNMVKKLSTVSPSPPGAGEEAGGEKEKDRDRGPLAMDEQLIGYSTPTYSLHLLRTPSGVSFVLLSSPVHESLRYVLQSIWKGAWVDFVVRPSRSSPLPALSDGDSCTGQESAGVAGQRRLGKRRRQRALPTSGRRLHPRPARLQLNPVVVATMSSHCKSIKRDLLLQHAASRSCMTRWTCCEASFFALPASCAAHAAAFRGALVAS